MDKAKKMAEQAQAKLDEVQKQLNTTQGGQQAGGGPAVEYDKHGRPIQPAPGDAGRRRSAAPPPRRRASRPPPGGAARVAPRPPRLRPDARARAAPKPARAAPAAAAPAGPPAPEDRNRPSTEPPKLSERGPARGLTRAAAPPARLWPCAPTKAC